jgi:hypothetical protein
MTRNVVTVERVRQVLNYDMDTGGFTWRHFKSPRALAGNEAGRVDRSNRRRIRIDGFEYYASRLAVLYVTGIWPKLYVDHRDRNPQNNAWENLREASPQQNAANSKPRGKIGIKGVHRAGKKFRSTIYIDGRNRSLGTFATVVEAAEAYEAAAKVTYGEFTRLTA